MFQKRMRSEILGRDRHTHHRFHFLVRNRRRHSLDGNNSGDARRGKDFQPAIPRIVHKQVPGKQSYRNGFPPIAPLARLSIGRKKSPEILDFQYGRNRSLVLVTRMDCKPLDLVIVI